MSKLVIVESPNKIKTIASYLGSDFKVLASVGHVVNLSTSGSYGLGIDTQTWEPKYKIDSDKKKIVSELKKAASQSSLVLIATDADREGEAIGASLVELLGIQDKYQRIRYNEITASAILEAIDKPTTINQDLVNSQKTRRMMDRIIGFRFSKLLNTKIKNAPTNPSAGRVQSVALKLVVDREKEIQAFIPYQYFNLLAHAGEQQLKYFNRDNPNPEWIDLNDINSILDDLADVKQVRVYHKKIYTKKEAQISPLKQSMVFRKLSSHSAGSVSLSLQRLYEGFGDQGLISYPRTDSTRLSQSFIDAAKIFIEGQYGSQYFAESIKGFAGDQDAHEAIRPTNLALTPEAARATYSLNDLDFKVYQLIYNTTLQALMKQPIRQVTRYEFEAKNHTFFLSGSIIIFDGYYKILKSDELPKQLPIWNEGDLVAIDRFEATAHETKPPARYSDGSLIEKLDEIRVGRPSTFASSVKILSDRLYVEKEGKTLKPTTFGTLVLEQLLKISPEIINVDYTAKVEDDLDQIALGQINYKDNLTTFWANIEQVIGKAEHLEQKEIIIEKVGQDCPQCQNDLIYRNNKKTKQRFIGCNGFPNCKFIMPDPNAKPVYRRFYNKNNNLKDKES
ncbi:DNA topoisomerase 1 [Mesomycoplasma conjunctivae]|nr:DNA topoisomerase 1 [Mesomycoplasma conjunctivae]